MKESAQIGGLGQRPMSPGPSEFADHSLRAGLVTSAAERGAMTAAIRAITGHKSGKMISVYTRRVDAFVDHAAEGLL